MDYISRQRSRETINAYHYRKLAARVRPPVAAPWHFPYRHRTVADADFEGDSPAVRRGLALENRIAMAVEDDKWNR